MSVVYFVQTDETFYESVFYADGDHRLLLYVGKTARDRI